MKKMLVGFVGLAFVVGLAYGMDTSFGTGDRKLDSTLEQLNVAAHADPDAFLRRLSSMHDIPEQELRRARDAYGLGGADLFMTTALARNTRRPVYSVAEEFKHNQGKGWGVIAQDMGIKPGSAEFHQLKRDAKSTARSGSQGKGHGKSSR
jgi:hypothetical protein